MKFKRRLILASTSKRRKKILKEAKIKFKVASSNLNESEIIREFKNLTPEKLVKMLALAKAISTIVQKNNFTDEIIAGFDTIVVCKKELIGKPKNKKDALKKLLFISNKEHFVYTGIALIDLKNKKILTGFEKTKIVMKEILRKDAISYIKTNEPMDKAGAYAIQGKAKKFVKSISGDFLNVVGLPLNKFVFLLKKLI